MSLNMLLWANCVQYSAVIPFKTDMAIELQEKGRVRFWAQVGKFTSNCQVEYVFNDTIISQGKVQQIFILHLQTLLHYDRTL